MRKSKIPEALQAEIKIEFQNQLDKGAKGVYDRVLKSFEEPGDRNAGNGVDGKPLKLTKAMIKHLISPPSEKPAKAAKPKNDGLQKNPKPAKKPIKAKTARKVKAPTADSQKSILMDYMNTMQSKAAAFDKIKELVNQ